MDLFSACYVFSCSGNHRRSVSFSSSERSTDIMVDMFGINRTMYVTMLKTYFALLV